MPLVNWSVEHLEAGVREPATKMALRGRPEGTVLARRDGSRVVEFSVILRPPASSRLELLQPIATFCASEGIRKDTGVITWIRWPNEVVAERAVVASAEVDLGEDEGAPWAVLTFRVSNGAAGGSGGTSLRQVVGTDVDQGLLTEKILESLAWMYLGYCSGMYTHIMKRVRSMVDTLGRRVSVTRPGRSIAGLAVDVDGRGRLVVEPDGGGRSLKVECGEQVHEL